MLVQEDTPSSYKSNSLVNQGRLGNEATFSVDKPYTIPKNGMSYM